MMTPADWERACVDAVGRVAKLEAEVARLKALIDDAEWSNYREDSSQLSYCPWCDARQCASGKHNADCPAFAPDGTVK